MNALPAATDAGPGTVTSTFTAPVVLREGVVTVTVVLVVPVIVPATPSNVTPVAPDRFVPVMTTDVPPFALPVLGDRLLIVGQSGTTPLDADDALPVPIAFVAVTVNVYVVFAARPVTAHDSGPDDQVHVRLPGIDVTV